MRTLTRLGLWLALTLAAGGAFAAATPNPVSNFFQWRPFLGPFHSVLLHFPIGFVVMAFLVDLYYLRRRTPETQRVVGLILLFAVLTSSLTILFGLMRSGSAEYDVRMLDQHRNHGIAVGVLAAATLVLHWLAYREGSTTGSRQLATVGYRGLLFVSMIVMVIAGHEGGNLTHGTNYLTKNAPQFVKELIEDAPEAPAAPATGTTNSTGAFFVEKIKPIFDTKCASCHGPEKQKGKYRLDQKAAALAGGESGKPAIKPGDPFESHLVRLILLPADHDDVMPPAGKSALTSDEVMTLIRWIQQGAAFPENSVATAPKPDKP